MGSLQKLLKDITPRGLEDPGRCQKRHRMEETQGGVVPRGPSMITPRARAATDTVFSDGNLVQHVMSMLAGPSKASRGEVGRLSLVCRMWRDVGRCEAIWRPVVEKMMPALTIGAGADIVSRGMGYRGYLQEYARSLLLKRAYVDDPLGGVDLHVKIWDEMDGATLSRGLARLTLNTCRTQAVLPFMSFQMGRLRTVPSLQRAVTPQQHRFSSYEDFTRRAHEPDMPSHIRMRVMVRNRATGTMALLWESGKERKLTATSHCIDDDVEGMMVSTRLLPLHGHSGSSVRACGWLIVGTRKSPAAVRCTSPGVVP